MKIGIIGAGRVGSALGGVWAAAGHEVETSFARERSALERTAARIGASAAEPRQAADADAVLLATPWGAVGDALEQAGSLEGRVLIDATNAVGAEISGSAAELFAERAAGARVVKAFNTVFAQLFEQAHGEDVPPSLVLCGDDADAKAVVAELARDAGFAPVDAGGLDQAGDVEALARLVIGLAYREGRGPFFYRLGLDASGAQSPEKEAQ